MTVPHFCVFGSSGFIGRNLVASLGRHPERHVVRAVLRHAGTNPFAGLQHVDVRIASLDNPRAISEAVAGCDVVYHLASGTVPSTSNENHHRDIDVNL